MRLSKLLFGLVFIAYATINLGNDTVSPKLVWWGLIVASIVWIVEGLFWSFTIPRVSRKAAEE